MRANQKCQKDTAYKMARMLLAATLDPDDCHRCLTQLTCDPEGKGSCRGKQRLSRNHCTYCKEEGTGQENAPKEEGLRMCSPWGQMMAKMGGDEVPSPSLKLG